ncbi:hypothetical protein ACVBEQ_13505 [Nakamurella sp. GG22]
MVVLLAMIALLATSTPASAGTFTDGYFFGPKYHFGDVNKGFIFNDIGVELRYDDTTFKYNGASGFGSIERGTKAVRVQIDFVRLGRVSGGVLAENLRAVNSGTGTTAISSTVKYTPVTNSGCAQPTRLWTRVGYSVRWSDGKLSKWTELGPPSDTLVCTG